MGMAGQYKHRMEDAHNLFPKFPGQEAVGLNYCTVRFVFPRVLQLNMWIVNKW